MFSGSAWQELFRRKSDTGGRAQLVSTSTRLDVQSDLIVFIVDQIIRDVIEVLESGNFDYVSNFANPCLPIGLDVEGFTAKALKDSVRQFSDELNREHVTIGLRESGLYRTISLNYPQMYPDFRLTIDTVQDLTNLTKVYYKLRKENGIELLDYTSTCGAISASIESGEELD